MPTNDNVDFWFENQMTSNYKTEEKTVTNIVKMHILSTSANRQVKHIAYYRTPKLFNLLIKNKGYKEADLNKTHYVVSSSSN